MWYWDLFWEEGVLAIANVKNLRPTDQVCQSRIAEHQNGKNKGI